jgi:hypothetical protein
MKYRTVELKVAVVIKPQTITTVATPSPTTFEDLLQSLDIASGQLKIPRQTSQPGCSQMRLGSEKSR